jgi:hypothetical protein
MKFNYFNREILVDGLRKLRVQYDYMFLAEGVSLGDLRFATRVKCLN